MLRTLGKHWTIGGCFLLRAAFIELLDHNWSNIGLIWIVMVLSWITSIGRWLANFRCSFKFGYCQPVLKTLWGHYSDLSWSSLWDSSQGRCISGNYPVECETCARLIQRGTWFYRRHYKSVHLRLKEFVCQDCNKMFAESGTLKRHKTRCLAMMNRRTRSYAHLTRAPSVYPKPNHWLVYVIVFSF